MHTPGAQVLTSVHPAGCRMCSPGVYIDMFLLQPLTIAIIYIRRIILKHVHLKAAQNKILLPNTEYA